MRARCAQQQQASNNSPGIIPTYINYIVPGHFTSAKETQMTPLHTWYLRVSLPIVAVTAAVPSFSLCLLPISKTTATIVRMLVEVHLMPLLHPPLEQ